MKRFFLLTLASAALLGASAAPVKTYEVKSPDGRLALVLTAGERLSFTVARDGETLVAPSEMALTLSTGEVLGESPRVRSARRRAVTETIDAPLYRQSRFDAAYNELDLRLRGDYGILARAYDDGVCYRFYTERDGELTIVDETAQLNFEGDPSAYIPYSKTEIPMRTSFENTYEYAPLSKFRTQTVAFMPVLVDLGERGYVLYTESDVEAYPGVYLTYDKEAKGFAARFAEYPTETSLTKRFQDVVERSADYIARVDGRITFTGDDGQPTTTDNNTPVSMNMWGFTPDYFRYSEEYFKEFLRANIDNPKAEYYIPLMVNKLITEGTATVEVLDTTAKWFGVTYAADRQGVVDKIRALVDAGEYPAKLF